MIERARLRLADTGSTWVVVAALVGLHALAALLFVIDLRLPIALLLGVAAVAFAVERPLWGIALLIAGRLTSTGANAWLRVGKVNIDLFEPALLLAVAALAIHAARYQKRVWVETPWRGPVLAFLAFQVLALGWSGDRTEALQEIVATGVLLTTTLLVLVFVERWEQLRALLYVWLATSVFIGAAAVLGVAGTSETSAFEMAQGSREGGFGQHPNWFAMNLAFMVPTAFGLGMIAERRWERWLLYGGGLFVFLAQMMSGSRGGSWSILIGLGLAALFHPSIRRVAVRVGVIAALAVGLVLLLDVGGVASAFDRIWTAGGAVLGKSVRVSNWQASFAMMQDTWGLGIGGGGYEEQLAHYDWWLYNSQYRYPHGIFWGMMAHWGVIGIGLWVWFLATVLGMARDVVRWTKGTGLQVVAWTMIASMFGYFCWSFVEFAYDDKPFWEWLALLTALWAIARREQAAS